jgi:hypothetical protein
MPSSEERWLDEDAGPVVRPYALIRGRTRPAGEAFDLVATVATTRAAVSNPAALDPEHFAIMRLARRATTVADLASDLDLPVGVLRVLLGDLRELGLILIRPPMARGQQADIHTLRKVLHGLRGL